MTTALLEEYKAKYEEGYKEVTSLIQENYAFSSIEEFISALEKLPTEEAPRSEIIPQPVRPTYTFDDLYQYKDFLHGFILNFTQNEQDAEEVLQDTFIRAFRNLEKFRGECSLKTWLFQIARNLSFNKYHYYRIRKKKDHFSINSPLSEETDSTYSDILPDNSDINSDIDINEYTERIKEVFPKLKPHFQEILHLRVVLDLQYEEIAQKLQLPCGTVKSRIARARDALAELIKNT